MRRRDIQDATGVIDRLPVRGTVTAYGAGAPTASAVGFAKGCLYFDVTNGVLYVNTGTNTSATWTALPTIAGTNSFTGSVLLSGTGTLGYATGAGGAVTQATSSSTGVTLNKPTGQITTVALTTAAGAEERFTVTNSFVAATDVVVLSTTYNGAGTVGLSVQKVAAGAFDVVITNLHAANAFDAAMVINFAVIKGAAA